MAYPSADFAYKVKYHQIFFKKTEVSANLYLTDFQNLSGILLYTNRIRVEMPDKTAPNFSLLLFIGFHTFNRGVLDFSGRSLYRDKL